MEWSYARDNKLPIAQLDSGKGAVELTGESVGKAVSEATVAGSGNDLALKLNYEPKTAGAYPALLTTYEVVCSKGLDAGKTALVKDFLTFFSSPDEQNALQDLGYAPLPSDLQSKVKTAVGAIS
jgi:phosphate transport system substrate-binding protein